MKKLLASLVVFSFLLVGCGGSSSEEFEVALVTDAGDINDKSFNQSAWEAVEQYQKDHDATIKYYKPASFDDAGYKSQIEEAVENGAKIIVCPGFKFCNAIGELQDKYKDVKFILIDATPTVPDEKDSTKSNPVDPGDNVYCALYTETQPGYLAGYAAVKAGHTKLGFMGGIALPAVINYGYGYIQGANDAAKEAGKYAIGVDSNQNDDKTGVVITSALKDVKKTVYDKLVDYKNDKFKGGIETLDASGGYVGLPDDFDRLGDFNAAAYKEVFDKVASGEIKIKSMTDITDNDNGNPTKVPVTNVNITYDK